MHTLSAKGIILKRGNWCRVICAVVVPYQMLGSFIQESYKSHFSQLFPNQCTTMMELNGNQGQRPLSQSKRCPTKVL